MGASHYDVAVHFVKGETNRPKKGHSMFTDYDNDRLFSWGEHFTIAIRDDKRKLYIINGDRYSVSTTRHQSEFRGALASYRKTGYTDITVPFSVVSRAGIDINTVEPVEVKSDIENAWCNTHNVSFSHSRWDSAWLQLQHHVRNTEELCETHYEHQLGGSVFRGKQGYMRSSVGRTDRKGYVYFLSGFDETHNDRTDGYFISQLAKPAKSVEEAFDQLKPKEVKIALANGLDVKRQGDAFAIPVVIEPEKKYIQRATMEDVTGWAYFLPNGKVCKDRRWSSHYGHDCKYQQGIVSRRIEYPNFPDPESHCANQVAVVNGKVYARGNIVHRPMWRNPEHKTIKLGKTWHRIVKNTAVASWGAGAKVD